ncbi:type II secretion system protein GspM [Massilia sp. TWR1-2-2]|uniref:type II secretion system protein GspM n=1 Tax=Massilia sp. TWR1-2-2 TaxID=2804584 RepID=UPI003CFA398F
MKQRLHLFVARVDALIARERAMLFAAAAVSIVFLLFALVLNPMQVKRDALRAELNQQKRAIAAIDTAITQQVQIYALDPDVAARTRLATLKADSEQLSTSLRAMQKGLVPPERIAPLLETILKANGRLQMVAMATLPATPVGAAVRVGAPAATAAASLPPPLLYRHGVQLTVRGNYLDMVHYLDALEAMPTQLFWGQAGLQVEEYPNARLSLTIYTLSLERRWITL